MLRPDVFDASSVEHKGVRAIPVFITVLLIVTSGLGECTRMANLLKSPGHP